ncbi:glycosyltransferase family A protein [Variovorax sp.]|uniref:glycosyltransferase family A protein n=1 Tax=Variovorax sp. TaxID=1871043 RepID=UPI002D731F8A|nr:glycosyltransferase family A protein [Variovorax sp.]HYP85650.1 glycosyltransferase family A protein [Variovorax sp.]
MWPDPGDRLLTVITPTIGRPGLDALIASIDAQTLGASRIFHILLWDDRRAPDAKPWAGYQGPGRLSLALGAGFGVQGHAPGSALRAVGLMAAATPWVTFADDDVTWAPEHAESLLAAAHGRQWATCLRRILSPAGEDLGVDRFESVGDDPSRRVPYEMCDGNTMVLRREWGVTAAPLFRETRYYDDDRRLYALLKANAGERGRSGRATIRQVCPDRLLEFFRAHCTP